MTKQEIEDMLLELRQQVDALERRLDAERQHTLSHLQMSSAHIACRDCVNDGLIPLKGVY